VVITYEHRAASLNSGIYTARARRNFKGIGLKLGSVGSAANWTNRSGRFLLGGVDIEKTLPHGGALQFAWAGSQGEIMGSGNGFGA